jgi:hypothetical protein
MNVNGYFPDHNIDELKADPDTSTVHLGRLFKDVTLQKVYDHQPGWEDDTNIEVEEGDHVLVTFHHDGTGYINFLSWYPNTFYYRTLIDADNPGTVEILKEL